ncbi:uncharacterized protein IL334_007975 [Kwoniella shivajii]|uniref:Ubiquitin-like protease family profile domain-containing protein n=1 Tax=Kwoniella shivajii TaxID=564305 RepID=A0ABZ1DA64_9TREE|nr:hypothetical protein IL334_007975 [Kwoniella shivajii]
MLSSKLQSRAESLPPNLTNDIVQRLRSASVYNESEEGSSNKAGEEAQKGSGDINKGKKREIQVDSTSTEKNKRIKENQGSSKGNSVPIEIIEPVIPNEPSRIHILSIAKSTGEYPSQLLNIYHDILKTEDPTSPKFRQAWRSIQPFIPYLQKPTEYPLLSVNIDVNPPLTDSEAKDRWDAIQFRANTLIKAAKQNIIYRHPPSLPDSINIDEQLEEDIQSRYRNQWYSTSNMDCIIATERYFNAMNTTEVYSKRKKIILKSAIMSIPDLDFPHDFLTNTSWGRSTLKSIKDIFIDLNTQEPIPFSHFERILGYAHIGDQYHWIGIAFYPTKKNAFIYDSLTIWKDEDVVKLLSPIVLKMLTWSNLEYEFGDWHFSHDTLVFQDDGYSCGPFTILNLMAANRNPNLSRPLSLQRSLFKINEAGHLNPGQIQRLRSNLVQRMIDVFNQNKGLFESATGQDT